MQHSYEPVSCEFHDELEAFSTLKKTIEIFYESDQGEISTIGKIIDLYSRDKVEYLLTDSNLEIRLDKLIRVDNVLNPR
jgi:Rho-binding antiterminator